MRTPNTIATNGEFGVYFADSLAVGMLADAYYGNINGNWTTLKRIASARLGHDIVNNVETMDLLVMLASNDGQNMSKEQLTVALAADEYNN